MPEVQQLESLREKEEKKEFFEQLESERKEKIQILGQHLGSYIMEPQKLKKKLNGML